MRRAIIAVCMIVIATVLTACTAAPSTPVGSDTPTVPVPPGAAVPAPGLQRPETGPAVAFGWVTRVDLEGGFWALVDSPPVAEPARQPSVVVVLLPGAVSEADFARLEGAYARATGTVADGASIRMAGPEMKVDAISGSRDVVPK